MTEQRADLFNVIRGIETDAHFRDRILQTINDLGLASFFPATIADIQIAIGYDLDRFAAHFDLERN